MRVIRADVGATCVYVPARRIIIIDPALGHEEAVVVIQATLPNVHPDAIKHWVEAVLPTVVGLDELPMPDKLSDTLILEFREMPVRSHRRRRTTRSKLVLAAAALVAVAGAGFGVIRLNATSTPAAWQSAYGSSSPAAVSVSDPLALPAPHIAPLVADASDPKPSPSATATPFEDVVFEKIEDHLKWRCTTVDGQSALMARCRTPFGLSLEIEKYLGPKSHTYVITYRGLRRAQRITLKVFADDTAKSRLMASVAANHNLFPNLVSGPNWAIYGSDRERVILWALGIGDRIDRPQSKTRP